MRDLPAVLGRHLVGDDGQAIVHLDGIAVDDLAVKARCQFHRQLIIALSISSPSVALA